MVNTSYLFIPLRLFFCIFAVGIEKIMRILKFLSIIAIVVLLFSCKSSFYAIERNDYASSDTAFSNYLHEQGIAVTKGNKVDILNGGHAKFERMFRDIRAAKHHVHLEYFNFRNDSINEVLITLLAEKAAEGVEVRAMFDAFGNMSNNRPLKKRHLKEIREKGIEIVKFDPIKFPWLNHAYHRDHRKIVVIDGKIGYTGGINVADYYLTGLEGIGEWRDMHARVEGEVVNELQKIFLAMWNRETEQSIGGEEYYPVHSLKGDADIAVVDRWPTRNGEQMRYVYANAINAAKDSVQLISPYFVPTKRVRRAIEKALKDSVKVEIMVSTKSDIPFTPDATHYVAYKLMKKGADIYMYDGGFNHSKVMTVDGKLTTIGSTNLNSRSLCYDYESNLFIFGKDDADELLQYYNEDKRESHKLTHEEWKKRSWWRKFCGWLGNLLTPFM